MHNEIRKWQMIHVPIKYQLVIQSAYTYIYIYNFTLVLLNADATPTSHFQPIRLLDQDFYYKFTYLIANSADPDQLASSEANWSESTLSAKAEYIRVQQDKS